MIDGIQRVVSTGIGAIIVLLVINMIAVWISGEIGQWFRGN